MNTGQMVKFATEKVAVTLLVTLLILVTEYQEQRLKWEIYTAGPTLASFPWKRTVTCNMQQRAEENTSVQMNIGIILHYVVS